MPPPPGQRMRASSLGYSSLHARAILERCRCRSLAFLHLGLTLSNSSRRKSIASNQVSASFLGSLDQMPEPARGYLRHLMWSDHDSCPGGDLDSLMPSSRLGASADRELAQVMQLTLDTVAKGEDHPGVVILRGPACAARWGDNSSHVCGRVTHFQG